MQVPTAEIGGYGLLILLIIREFLAYLRGRGKNEGNGKNGLASERPQEYWKESMRDIVVDSNQDLHDHLKTIESTLQRIEVEMARRRTRHREED